MTIVDEHNRVINTNLVEAEEQRLAKQFIQPNDVVLELGARYGSVSCVINHKLACKTAQVVVEPDSRVWTALETNRTSNNCHFHIVKGFVANKPLRLTEMHTGYGTTSEDANGLPSAPSFTLAEIQSQHGLTFNALVADCEGFLGQFLEENPCFLHQLRIVIFEADYPNKCDYDKIRETLKLQKFVEVKGGFQNVWVRNGSNAL